MASEKDQNDGQAAQLILNKLAEPVHITLTKNTKGYGWEVSVHAETIIQAMALVEEADKALSAKYSSGGGEKE
jgi:hypothetical protein